MALALVTCSTLFVHPDCAEAAPIVKEMKDGDSARVKKVSFKTRIFVCVSKDKRYDAKINDGDFSTTILLAPGEYASVSTFVQFVDISCATGNDNRREGRETTYQNDRRGHPTCSLIVGPDSIQGLGTDHDSVLLRSDIINHILPAAGYVVFDSFNASYAGIDPLQLKMSLVTSRYTTPSDGPMTPSTFKNTFNLEIRNSSNQIYSQAAEQYNIASSPVEIPARRRVLLETARIPYCNLTRY
jgi:hypothetical protein